MLTDIPVHLFLIFVMVALFACGVHHAMVQLENNKADLKSMIYTIIPFIFGYLIYYGLTIQDHPAVIFLR